MDMKDFVHPDDIAELVPIDKPNAARMYDYCLGGFHSFEVDQQAAEQMLAFYPDVKQIALANRAFLRRAVACMLEQGIDQFLDIGSGLPTVGNVHTMAQEANPDARVVYVDIDPVAVEHSKLLLKDNPNALALQADAHYPEIILNNPDVRQLLDFTRPIGVMFIAVLQFITDDAKAYHAVRTVRDALVSGSYIAIAHYTNAQEKVPANIMTKFEDMYNRAALPIRARSHQEIATFFEGLELVEPGLVYVPHWRPQTSKEIFLNEPERACNFAGVGRKP